MCFGWFIHLFPQRRKHFTLYILNSQGQKSCEKSMNSGRLTLECCDAFDDALEFGICHADVEG